MQLPFCTFSDTKRVSVSMLRRQTQSTSLSTTFWTHASAFIQLGEAYWPHLVLPLVNQFDYMPFRHQRQTDRWTDTILMLYIFSATMWPVISVSVLYKFYEIHPQLFELLTDRQMRVLRFTQSTHSRGDKSGCWFSTWLHNEHNSEFIHHQAQHAHKVTSDSLELCTCKKYNDKCIYCAVYKEAKHCTIKMSKNTNVE